MMCPKVVARPKCRVGYFCCVVVVVVSVSKSRVFARSIQSNSNESFAGKAMIKGAFSHEM